VGGRFAAVSVYRRPPHDETEHIEPARISDMRSADAQVDDLVKRALTIESHAIATIPLDNPFQEITTLIYERCHDHGGKVVLSGVGKAGGVASKLATTFSSTGTPAVFLHPLEAVHGDIGVLGHQDILFLISNSGETREIVELVPLCRRLVGELPVICMTGQPNSSLADLADHVLLTGTPKEICPLGLTPTTSTTVMGVLGDILVMLQITKTGFDERDYALRHHGGYLGGTARAKLQASSMADKASDQLFRRSG
jgi:arabinose-5-phosphate isomerase